MADSTFTEHSFHGVCSVCGKKGIFIRDSNLSIRETYKCQYCRSSLRYRDQASLIVDEFGEGLYLSIAQLVSSGKLNCLSIYEAALHGPFVKYFNHLPGYVQSFYWEDIPSGQSLDGIRCEDLTGLSFEDETFDLLITSDVMEHIANPTQAFQEIHRVLKPLGCHIFTIPNRWPLSAKTEKLAEISESGFIYHHPPRYHQGGDNKPSLVISEFGADLVDNLTKIGFRTKVVRRNLVDFCYQNATFLSYKVSSLKKLG